MLIRAMKSRYRVRIHCMNEQYDDGGYYFAHNVFDYSDIMGESDKSRLFKNWKVTDVYKSGGYGGHVYLTAQFYDELNVVYHLPEGAVNSPDNLSTYPQGKSDIILGNASMEGYTFDGWYLDAEFTLPTASIDATQTGTVHLYGKFKPAVYDISYELNGGTNDAGNPATYTYGIGVTEFKPAVKEGYTFDGWYLDAEFKLPTASIDATQTGEVVLHAKFTLNPPVDPGDREEPEDEENPGNDEKPENPGNTETPTDNDPKLGEDNITVLLTGLTGLAGLGIFTMTLKRRRKSERE